MKKTLRRNIINQKSFTLIELLVVIAIIGLLASMVFVGLKGALERAKKERTNQELNQIMKAIIVARFREDKVLLQITGSGCSDCACRTGEDLSTISDTHSCIINWQNAFNRIGINPIRDSWGSPYLIDENETEGYCRKDTLKSAGPNKIAWDGDDFGIEIDFYYLQCP